MKSSIFPGLFSSEIFGTEKKKKKGIFCEDKGVGIFDAYNKLISSALVGPAVSR